MKNGSPLLFVYIKMEIFITYKTNDVNISDKRLMRYEEKISYDFYIEF